MDKKSKIKLKIALILNIIIVIFEILGVILTFKRLGVGTLKYYTTESNLLAFVSSAIFTYYSIKALKKDNPKIIPNWIKIFKFMTTTCLTVTFIVVVAVLAPFSEGGYKHMLFDRDLLYYHLLCPLISIISFIFFETNSSFSIKHSLIATIPTIIYAAISVTLNILYIMRGPYPFLYVYEQPVYMSIIWTILIVGGAFLLNTLLRISGKVISNKL
jgi:hypothetical protein